MSVVAGVGAIAGERNAPGAGLGSVSDRMDRLPLTWLHIGIIVVAAFGFTFDLMEVALGNVLSAVFSAPPYSVDAVQLSWLLSAMYIGAIPGALLAGWLADRHGRRIVLIGILLVLFVTSIAAAISPDINTLIVSRMLSGLALGAYPPLMIAFLADLMPPKRRGTVIMMTAGLASLGPVAMIFLVRALTEIQPFGIEAWRWAFILGAAGSILVAVAYCFVPESPRWLSASGREAEAQKALARFERSSIALGRPGETPLPLAAKAGSAERSSDRPSRRVFALVAGIYFFTPWATVAFPVLMGAVLIEKGFNLSDSLLYVGISMFGPAIGTMIGSLFVDRIERRVALIAFAIGMIAAAVAYAVSFEPIWLMVAGVVFQLLAMLYVPTMTTYAAELFPTEWRARTSTGAWSVNRLASAIAPLVLLPMLKIYGIWPMFGLIIATLVIGIVIVAMAPNGKAGRAVD